MKQNVSLSAEWLSTGVNGMADALSRMNFKEFRRLSNGKMEMWPVRLPQEIWSLQKIWLSK